MKHSFLLTACCLAILCLTWPGVVQGQSTERQPNFIFLVADDLNDYTGFSGGHQQAVSPNLDRIAREGWIFDNAYCNSPVCAASRASFMSGKDPMYTQVVNNTLNSSIERVFRNMFRADIGNETVFTIPEVLKDSGGYYTIGVNKLFHGWYTSGYNNDYDTSTTDNCSRGLSWNEFYDFHPDTDVIPAGPPWYQGVPGFPYGSFADSLESQMVDYRVADSAIAFLDRYAENPSRYCDRPYFLAVGFRRPHAPHFVPEKYFLPFFEPDLFIDPYPIPYNESGLEPPDGLVMPPQPDPIWADFDSLPGLAQGNAIGNGTQFGFDSAFAWLTTKPVIDAGLDSVERAYTFQQIKQAGAAMAYLASVSLIDAQIGRILDELESHPELRENTVIVFISDHGFSLGEKRHWGKFTPWETDMRIPMFIYDPRQPGGHRVNEVVSLLDVFPTFLDYAGIDAPLMPDSSEYLDGRSLVPSLLPGNSSSGLPVLLTQRAPETFDETTCFLQHGVRDGNHRYIRWTGNTLDCIPGAGVVEEELYNLGLQREIDPNEWTNLIDGGAFVRDHLDDYLPDGDLFDVPYLEVSMVGDSLPCALAGAGPLALHAVTPYSDNLVYTWKVEDTPGEFSGPVLTMDAVATSAGQVGVSLKVVDTLTGAAGSEVRVFQLAGVPNPTFDLQATDDRTVEVTGFDPGMTYFSAVWDYGDGFIWTGTGTTTPPSHRYAKPGTFIVSVEVFYGNSRLKACSVQFQKSLTVDPSAFPAGTCPAPTNGWVDNTGIGQSTLEWVDGFDHVDWEIRWQEEKIPLETWSSSSASTRPVDITGLRENTEYRWQVRANCGSGTTSEWSPAFRFITDRCPEPTGLGTGVISATTAELNWNGVSQAAAGFEIELTRLPSGPTVTSTVPAGTESTVLTGLGAWRYYSVSLASLCQESSSSDIYVSDRRPEIRLETIGKVLEEVSIVPAALNRLAVEPNPSPVDQVRIVSEMSGEGSGRLEVFNAEGRLVHHEMVSWLEGSTIKTINLGDQPPGLYFVTIQGWTAPTGFFLESE